MTPTLLLSMVAFAVAASLSPGPVNLVALSAGVKHGFRSSLRHVSGATLGFTLLLLLIGLGLHQAFRHWPSLTEWIRWAGVAFLLFMAYKLAADNGRLGHNDARPPSMLVGATMQWLNPKAWMASIAGMGAYTAGGDTTLVLAFSGLFFAICYASLACWAAAGAFMGRWLQNPAQVRWFNRGMAATLVISALTLSLM
ncbi:LysE family translocator [Halomonas sp. WWR20]